MMIFLLMLIVNVFGKLLVQEQLSPFESPFEESSFIIGTNQGRFAVNHTNFTQSTITPKTNLASIFSANTLDEILDETAALEKAWARLTFPHVSLLMQFDDGKCEQMEWYPLSHRPDVPGEHPVGQASIKYVRNARCRNAPSHIRLPETTIDVLDWLQDAIKLKSTQEEVDLLRWVPGSLQPEVKQHITRRQIYSAFFEEANRFKDEEKYSCSSFINNAFGIATGHRYVDPGTLVHLLKVGVQRFGEDLATPSPAPANPPPDKSCCYASCSTTSDCCRGQICPSSGGKCFRQTPYDGCD